MQIESTPASNAISNCVFNFESVSFHLGNSNFWTYSKLPFAISGTFFQRDNEKNRSLASQLAFSVGETTLITIMR